MLVLADESAQLQGLFFGGLPYLVQCVGPSDPLHRAFSEAAPKLVKEGVIPVAVDCGAKMPSGKTIYDRFFAGKDVSAEPFFFLVANKDAPRHLAITPNKQVFGFTRTQTVSDLNILKSSVLLSPTRPRNLPLTPFCPRNPRSEALCPKPSALNPPSPQSYQALNPNPLPSIH